MAVTSAAQAQSPLVNLWHATGGLFIWEYFTTLDYEWRIIRGRLPYRWTIWIYSLARLATLVSIILTFVIMDTTTPINCQLWVLFSIIFICLASTAASLLIVIRTIVIWNRNYIVVALASTVWGTSIVFHLFNMTRLVRFEWVSAHRTCEPVKIDAGTFGYIPAIIADIILLLITLTGLFILRRDGGGVFGLTRLIWNQGIIWLILVSAAEVPSIVFTLLHANDQSHHLFDSPSQILMLIAATRMHRSLVNFASESSNIVPESPLHVHTAFEKHRTDPMSDDNPSTTTSTSEKIPVVSDRSKLDSTRASTSPLPTVSPYPIPEARSA